MPLKDICKFDHVWIDSIEIDDAVLSSNLKTADFMDESFLNEMTCQSWLLKGTRCLDLSLLFGNETPNLIKELCNKAAHPLEGHDEEQKSRIKKLTDGAAVQCAAVCVYPLRIEDACKGLADLGVDKSINVASVAAGFPTGQFPLHSRLAEIYYAVASGASEIDVVIDRSLVLRHLWSELYNELLQMRRACPNQLLKVILSVSELGPKANVYKAAVVAMMAGCDFIKTSTGKEATSMTILDGYVMCLAIKDFYGRSGGAKVGLKPAGGVRTSKQVITWMAMVQKILGDEWVDPKLFRIGTSGNSSLIESLGDALKSLK